MAALINGVEYSWSMIEFKLSILQNNISSVSEISYEKSREITNNYGAGVKPVSRSYGNETYTASITIALSELTKISSSVVGGIFSLDPFSVTIKYAHPESGKTIIDTLYGCEFIKDERSVSQNDAEVNVSLDMNIVDVQMGDDSLI